MGDYATGNLAAHQERQGPNQVPPMGEEPKRRRNQPMRNNPPRTAPGLQGMEQPTTGKDVPALPRYRAGAARLNPDQYQGEADWLVTRLRAFVGLGDWRGVERESYHLLDLARDAFNAKGHLDPDEVLQMARGESPANGAPMDP